jgi:hypothetical protein
MIQFVVGSCAVDSIGYALQNAGMLSLLVDNADLPPNFGISLTTDYFEFIIPATLQQVSGQEHDRARLHAVAAAPGRVEQRRRREGARVHERVGARAAAGAGVYDGVDADGERHGGAQRHDAGADARLDRGQSAVIASNFGTGWESLVAPLLTDAIRYVALPIANQQLASGFAIPTSGKMKLSNPVVQISNNLLVVASDFTLHL